MRLHNLPKSGGFRKRKRVGRGEGNGLGKTSGRGQKGQRARSGHSLRPGFESGHVPLYRKLPKRGFSNYRFTTRYAVVNVTDLARVEGDVADREAMVKAGLVRRSAELIKVLGDGDLDRALTVKADKFSASARAKIEQAGGKVELTSPEAAEQASDSDNAAE
ncbi:MAG: large subunit ribosomal protein L15 [Puniceicoccaceae bacterium 5H]|nr:MAG: large subunit ribosomal protein L15 [Puniceicoccaceae bacterium 5H]